ncbi:MAG: type II secretion system protein GspK [Planctomycetota bacterium]|jgi:hypothetical protein
MSHSSSTRGFALITVLVIVAILGSLVVMICHQAALHKRTAEGYHHRMLATQAMNSVEALTRFHLAQDLVISAGEADIDTLEDPWQTALNRDLEEYNQASPARVRIRITDLSGTLNLNRYAPVFMPKGKEEDQEEAASAEEEESGPQEELGRTSIDPLELELEDLLKACGAENPGDLIDTLRAALASAGEEISLTLESDLTRLPGLAKHPGWRALFASEIFWNAVSVKPNEESDNTQVNVNVASKPVLMALLGDRAAAETILSARPFRQASELNALLPNLSESSPAFGVTSNDFRLEMEATKPHVDLLTRQATARPFDTDQ